MVNHFMHMHQQQERRDRKSDDRNKQTIGGRGPKSLSRRDVSATHKLLKVQSSNSMQQPVSLHGNIKNNPFCHQLQTVFSEQHASDHCFHWLIKSAFHNVHLLVTAAIAVHRPLQYTDAMCQIFQRLPARLSHMDTIHISSHHHTYTNSLTTYLHQSVHRSVI